ncbi:MAG: hypothetical protein ACI9OJ_004080 [Myxococcota bacterium]|jgi:hypothetical protein
MNDHRAELDALLAGKAMGALEPDESTRLEELLAQLPDVDAEEFDRLVGEVTAALATSSPNTMPPELLERIARKGQEMVAQSDPGRPRVLDGLQSNAATPPTTRGGSGWVTWSGWAVAAVMSALWLGGMGQAEAPPEPTLAELRAELIEASGDAVEVAWSATEDPAATGATGDVVWSNTSQSGMMRFVGLEANDPSQLRYQLWIFDSARDERFPIDGGLFDVQPGATEVLVPVDARLLVNQPTLFAVTVERSDGVVVSDRGRIVVIAPMADLSQAGQ